MRGRFVEVDEPRRLRYEWEIEPDGQGSRLVEEHARLPDDERREIVTVGWSASVEQILAVLA